MYLTSPDIIPYQAFYNAHSRSTQTSLYIPNMFVLSDIVFRRMLIVLLQIITQFLRSKQRSDIKKYLLFEPTLAEMQLINANKNTL